MTKIERWTGLFAGCAAVLLVVACGVTTPDGGGNGNANTNANANDNGGMANANDNSDGADTFVSFEDPDSDFATTDVRDVEGELMRFDAAAEQLFWVADGSRHDGWVIEGNFLGAMAPFQVRFGSEGGEQRAYFTETDRPTICNLVVENGRLSIFATSTPVPQN